MNIRLLILGEGRFDLGFFAGLVKKVTGVKIQETPHRKSLHLYHLPARVRQERMRQEFQDFLRKARDFPDDLPTLLIVVRDNDRAPFGPGDERPPSLNDPYDRLTQNRLRELEALRNEFLPLNDGTREFPCAVGVTREMIEAWLLLHLCPQLHEAGLPIFGNSDDSIAIRYYQALGLSVPLQLKDLLRAELNKIPPSDRPEFTSKAASELDLISLAARSPSFAAFHAELEALPKPRSADRPGGPGVSA